MTELTTEEREHVARLLEEARDLMNDEGRHWTQGALSKYLEDGKTKAYCSLGAMRALEKKYGYATRLRAEVALAKSIRFPKNFLDYDPPPASRDSQGRIITLNDDPKTKWEDIKKVFTSAARRVREGKVAI